MFKPHVLLAILWERLVHCRRPARFFIFFNGFFATGEATRSMADIAKPEFEFHKLLNIIPCKEFEDICRAAVENWCTFRYVEHWLTMYARADFMTVNPTSVPTGELSDAATKYLRNHFDFSGKSLEREYVMFYMAKTLTPMMPDAPKLIYKHPGVPVIDRNKPVPESEINRNTRDVVSFGMTLIFLFVECLSKDSEWDSLCSILTANNFRNGSMMGWRWLI